MAAEHVLHMQKALDEMNLQIHRVLNDITGVSGLRILDAILAGERGSLTLARLCAQYRLRRQIALLGFQIISAQNG